MIVQIPMTDYADFTEEVTLDDRPYTLRFRWNTRGAFWVMAIYDRNEVLLVDGIKLVIGYPLNRQYSSTLMPPGMFYCIDTNTTTQYVEPGRNDFIQDRNIVLAYVDEDENDL
jgi:hypothetical protein